MPHFKASEETGKAVILLYNKQNKDKINKNIPKYLLNTKTFQFQTV